LWKKDAASMEQVEHLQAEQHIVRSNDELGGEFHVREVVLATVVDGGIDLIGYRTVVPSLAATANVG
jgi:hypothetical protein